MHIGAAQQEAGLTWMLWRLTGMENNRIRPLAKSNWRGW
jgi:hypothetical protein